jgi:fatty acid desaturase
LAFIRQPSLLWGIIAGVFSAFIGLNVQHDANHGAMSRDPKVNTFWGSMADLIGQCRWLWIQQHVVHHHGMYAPINIHIYPYIVVFGLFGSCRVNSVYQ